MPKIHGTKKQKAAELLARLEQGPSFSDPSRMDKAWNDESEGFPHQYKLWAETWIIPSLKRLVPELKNEP